MTMSRSSSSRSIRPMTQQQQKMTLIRGGISRSRHRSNHHVTFVLVFVTVFLACTKTLTCAAATTTTTEIDAHKQQQQLQLQQQMQPQSNNNKNVVHIPLIPHHAQAERRARERRQLVGIERLHQQYQTNVSTTTSAASLFSGDGEYEEMRGHYYRRQLADSADHVVNDAKKVQVASLFQGYGTHYADLWCGTPPQRQTVIVDTGSGVTAFPCVGCKDCGVPDYHIDQLYDFTKSDTFHKLSCNECLRGSCSGSKSCRIGMSYQEGSSWNAMEVRDKCYVGGMHDVAVTREEAQNMDDLNPFDAASFAFPLNFGCQDRVTGLFKTQLADGIMGMDNAAAAFWAQMSKSLKINRQFSLCFSRSPIASRQGTNAGAMTLGGFDDRFHQSKMLYADVDRGGGFYGVQVRNIFLKESESLPNTKENLVSLFEGNQRFAKGISAIVDSGTTDSYFERTLAASFNKAWMDMVGTAFGHGSVKLTDEQLSYLPTIVFQVGGNVKLNQAVAEGTGPDEDINLVGEALDSDHPYDILVHMPPQHYMEYNAKDDTYSARFYVDESPGGSVMGANLMMGHNVFFDVDSNIIGWAPSDCDYEALVQPFVDQGALVPNDNSKEDAEAARQQNNNENEDETEEIIDKAEKNNGGPGDHDAAAPPTDEEETILSSATSLLDSVNLGLCDTQQCKFTATVISASVVGVLLIAVVLLRRRRQNRYEATAVSELELQAGPRSLVGNASADDDDDNFTDTVRYRDHEETSSGNAGLYLVDPEYDEEGNPRGVYS